MKNLKVGDFVSTQTVFGEYMLLHVKEISEREAKLENFIGGEVVVSREALGLFYNKVVDSKKIFVDFISENLKKHLIASQYEIYVEKTTKIREEYENSIKGL